MTFHPCPGDGDIGSLGEFRCEPCGGMIAPATEKEDVQGNDESAQWIEIEDEQETE